MKTRLAFYDFSSFLSTVTLRPQFFDSGYIMARDLFTPDSFFNVSFTSFPIINSYSTPGWSNNTCSVHLNLIFPNVPGLTLTLGDLNIHHPTPDPLRSLTEYELATSAPYFDRATQCGFSLLKCYMCTSSGNGTQRWAVPNLLCLLDLYLVYLIGFHLRHCL